MAKTEAKVRATPSSRSRSILFIVIAALALAALAVAALFFSQRSSGGVAVWYTTLGGTELKESESDAPLRALVRVPNSDAPVDTAVLALGLQLVDESGQPARYGRSTESTLPMKPALQKDLWEYTGSMPTTPGTYHARLQIQRASSLAEPETIDLPGARIQVKSNSGAQLTSGFVLNRDGNLWIASTDVSRQRRLTFFDGTNEHGANPSWSPDGKSIAFAYLPKSESDALPRTGIWSLNPAGTDLKQLVAPGPGETLFEPAWSPDGQTIFFSVDRMSNDPLPPGTTKADTDKYRRIDSIDLKTGARSQLVPGAQTPSNIGPDGKMLFLQDVAPANPGDTPGQQLVYGTGESNPLVLVKPNSFPQMNSPALSPDSKWVVFSAPNGSPGEGRLDFFQWLVFAPQTAYAHDLPWDLFMVPASGGETIRLTTLDEDRPFPVWLDNSTVAFLGERGLYKASLDASGNPTAAPARLTEGAYHGHLTWRGP